MRESQREGENLSENQLKIKISQNEKFEMKANAINGSMSFSRKSFGQQIIWTTDHLDNRSFGQKTYFQ
jgi:hypothetical protein